MEGDCFLAPLVHNKCDFYPRPHMEGDTNYKAFVDMMDISTHALTWRETRWRSAPSKCWRFLPTPSHGGRPQQAREQRDRAEFLPTPSHGGRPLSVPAHDWLFRFLPTPSHGGRPLSVPAHDWLFRFLPTPSHGGRLCRSVPRTSPVGNFYPRPHMEGDIPISMTVGRSKRFLPTPSHGGRLYLRVPDVEGIGISTHALTWRATARVPRRFSRCRSFLPTPSHGGRQGGYSG